MKFWKIKEVYRRMNYEKGDIFKILAMILSAFIYGLNMKVFVEAGNLFPSGFAGISRVISMTLDTYFSIKISFGVFYWLLNGLATFLVLKFIGKKFTFYSVIQFSLSTLFILLIPSFPITQDIMLITVFGGILNGIAISIALSNNGSSGGFDFIAIYTSNKFNMSTWSYIMYANGIILLVAGLLFGWNAALYSIIYQFTSTQIIRNLHKRYDLNAIYIVTDSTKELNICNQIFKISNHSVTKTNGIGEYSKKGKVVLYLTCNHYQTNKICNAIKKVDPNVFITVSSVDKIIGNFYQAPLD